MTGWVSTVVPPYHFSPYAHRASSTPHTHIHTRGVKFRSPRELVGLTNRYVCAWIIIKQTPSLNTHTTGRHTSTSSASSRGEKLSGVCGVAGQLSPVEEFTRSLPLPLLPPPTLLLLLRSRSRLSRISVAWIRVTVGVTLGLALRLF